MTRANRWIWASTVGMMMVVACSSTEAPTGGSTGAQTSSSGTGGAAASSGGSTSASTGGASVSSTSGAGGSGDGCYPAVAEDGSKICSNFPNCAPAIISQRVDAPAPQRHAGKITAGTYYMSAQIYFYENTVDLPIHKTLVITGKTWDFADDVDGINDPTVPHSHRLRVNTIVQNDPAHPWVSYDESCSSSGFSGVWEYDATATHIDLYYRLPQNSSTMRLVESYELQ
jgi:hypothetical protein